MRDILCFIIMAAILSGCHSSSWEKTPEGVEISLKKKEGHPRKIRIEVLTDRIMHVEATPETEFSDARSLMIDEIAVFQPVAFDVEGDKDTLTISTKELHAVISLSNGRLVFYDKNSGVILQEPMEGGKSFSPVTVEGTEAYTLHQVFDSPSGESFHGLGQHQSDEFNYKGLNESLYQYNTKVSIPFIVSSKNYGLLWDNYSLTKFGDPRDYSEMDLFTLYDEKGHEGGLTATYLINSDTSKVFTKRIE
jgi:alpha-D-xyloside xylohydrolase